MSTVEMYRNSATPDLCIRRNGALTSGGFYRNYCLVGYELFSAQPKLTHCGLNLSDFVRGHGIKIGD